MKRLFLLLLLFIILSCSVFLSGCEISEQVAATPTVEIGDISYESNADEISIANSEELRELISARSFFNYLKKVDISQADLSPAEKVELEQAFPAAYVDYSLIFCGQKYDGHITELDLSNIAPSDAVKNIDVLPCFPYLKKVNIIKEDGSCDYKDDDYIAIQNAIPDIQIEYNFEIFGKTLNTLKTTELNYKNESFGDKGLNYFRKYLPYASALQYLCLDDCETTNESMASLRDEFPNIKIVWRVYYGTGLGNSCMTDVETIWAIGCLGIDPEETAGLYYCTDVKYMDIGHNSVTNIDFLYNMPNLEVLIIACGEFNDVTAVGSLKNLEYLEVGETHVRDLTPLVNCEHLEHLHIGGSYELTDADVEPLLAMKHLKRLNCANMSNAEFHSMEMEKKFRAAMPDTELIFGNIYGSSFWGEWRYGDGPNGYHPRYALLREQIGYDK